MIIYSSAAQLDSELRRAYERIDQLESELRRSWRPWPPEGPKRVVDCLRFVEGTVREFQHYSDERMILPNEVFYQEVQP